MTCVSSVQVSTPSADFVNIVMTCWIAVLLGVVVMCEAKFNYFVRLKCICWFKKGVSIWNTGNGLLNWTTGLTYFWILHI